MMRTYTDGAGNPISPFRSQAMRRTHPTCRACDGAIYAGGARILASGGLAHSTCAEARCTVCDAPAESPAELDSSGRCDRCAP